MKAYWIVRCHVNDLNEFSKYAKLAGPIIHKHNGNFLARGGEQKELEGDGYERTVLVEFNSSEQAHKCYNSKTENIKLASPFNNHNKPLC